MNTKTFVILGIILLIIGVGYIATQSPASENALTSDSSNMSDSDTMTTDTAPMTDEAIDEPEMADTADDVNEPIMDEAVTTAAEQTETITGPGSYAHYSEDALAASNADTKLIFFHATWCPSCRALDADITDSLGDIPSNIAIFKADYDTAIALRQTHGVTLQHTIVQVDDAGNQLKKWSGANTLEGVLAEL